MATTKTTDWKQRVIGVRELLTNVRQNAFRIATELTAIYRDDAFLTDAMIDGDDNKATKYLDDLARGLLFTILPEGRSAFHDLRAMLEYYPDAAYWQDGDLSNMYDAMLMATERHDSPSPVKQTPRVKRAEHEAVVEKLQATSKRAERLEHRVKTIAEQVAELRTENAELKAENSRLRTENQHLRSLNSEPVAA